MLTNVKLVDILRQTMYIMLPRRTILLMYVLLCNIIYTMFFSFLHLQRRNEINETEKQRRTTSS